MTDGQDDEIDFENIKKFFKSIARYFKGSKSETETQSKPRFETNAAKHGSSGTSSTGTSDTQGKEDELDIKDSLKKTYFYLKNNSSWIIPLVMILSIFIFAFYIRAQTYNLPVADSWGESSVQNFYKNQIRGQIARQYPNLPESNRETLVSQEFAKLLKQNGDMIKQQSKATADQLRDQFRAPDGTTYLLGIDPYAFFRQTRNLLDHGNIGTGTKDGETFDTYYVAPNGRFQDAHFHPYFSAFIVMIMSLFGYSLMHSFFYVGALVAALSIIPAFFIARRVGGNVGGFFAALFTAVSVFFVSRTAGESSDTDAYNVFFPLLISWLFLAALEQKEWKKRMGLLALASFASGLFAFAWVGWWFIWYLTIAVILIQLLYYIILNSVREKKFAPWGQEIKDQIVNGILFFILSSIFILSFIGWERYIDVIRAPFNFIALKAVATTSIWPNVLTTVAELNPTSYSQVINQLGGNLLLVLSLIGCLITLRKKDSYGNYDLKYLALVSLWLLSTLWSTSRGVRFILLVVPAVTLGFGFFCGVIYSYFNNWVTKELKINKNVSSIAIVGILMLPLLLPNNIIKAGYDQGYNSVPSMNDGWYNALSKIDQQSDPNSIITSWWDFGHWFKAIGNRRVTFDGETQGTPQAHWVGKLLLSSNESVSVGILRMLDCGGNNAFVEIDKLINDTHESVKIVNQLIVKDREEASEILLNNGFSPDETEKILSYTHCNAPEGYVIASDDMIGKSGVWGHFGSWDFDRADMVYKTYNAGRSKAIEVLQTEFNMSAEQASGTYSEIASQDPNRWIAPWPGYISGPSGCRSDNETIMCGVSMQGGQLAISITKQTMNTTVLTQGGAMNPSSITFDDGNTTKTIYYPSPNIGLAVMLLGSGEAALLADSQHGGSLFAKMFFYRGKGLNCFELFDEQSQVTGGKIYVYKVDWECKIKQ